MSNRQLRRVRLMADYGAACVWDQDGVSFKIRVKSGHKADGGPARMRLVISPTTLRLTLPAISF
jgi:hypothetical protein